MGRGKRVTRLMKRMRKWRMRNSGEEKDNDNE